MTQMLDTQPKFWLPSMEENRYSVPTQQELTNIWQRENGTRELLELDERIYNVAEIPDTPPAAYISVDLCEVVRHSGLSLLKMRGGTLEDMVVDDETNNFDYGSEINGWPEEIARTNRQKYLQEFMHHQVVEPVPFSDSIGAFLRKWRAQGAYVIANTSTLPGCEESTIEFLAQQYPGCFAGILLPRNYDGKGPVTKFDSLDEVRRMVDATLTVTTRDKPIVAIDDAAHHALAFDRADANVQAIMPEYKWNRGVDTVGSRIVRIAQGFGTVDAFIHADQYLQPKLASAEVTQAV